MYVINWLEYETSTPPDNLTGKTTVKYYLGNNYKSKEPASPQKILAVLRKNPRKLGVDVLGRAFQERLAKEYEASLEKLLPIKQKLATTDRLIDQVVYALNGLTEEDIAIVEGST